MESKYSISRYLPPLCHARDLMSVSYLPTVEVSCFLVSDPIGAVPTYKALVSVTSDRYA